MIAGYVTATTTDLARVLERKGDVYLADRATFKNKDFSDFESILNLYLRRFKLKVGAACLGVAGPVINNEVKTTNFPWHLKGRALEDRFTLRQCRIVNDLVATAQGLFALHKDKFFTINEGNRARQGNIGLLAAGTGLGEALVLYAGDRYIPYASEGGHANFTPCNQIEAELWAYIYAQQEHVEVEDVISFTGIETIYRFMLEHERATMTDWFKKARDKPAAIIENALSGVDPVAVKALDLLIDCFASELSNLALKGMTLGGIYLGGKVAPSVITAVDRSRFMQRFAKSSKMKTLLNDIPVGVILDHKTALLGAASMVLEL